MCTLANSDNPNEMPQNVAFHLDENDLQRKKNNRTSMA